MVIFSATMDNFSLRTLSLLKWNSSSRAYTVASSNCTSFDSASCLVLGGSSISILPDSGAWDMNQS